MKSLSQHINESLELGIILESLDFKPNFSLNDIQIDLVDKVKKSKLIKELTKLGKIERVEVIDYFPTSMYSGLTFTFTLDSNVTYSKAFKYDNNSKKYDITVTQDSYALITSDGSKISGGYSVKSEPFSISSKIEEALKNIVKGKIQLPSDKDCYEIEEVLKAMAVAYIGNSYYTMDKVEIDRFSYTKTKKIDTSSLKFRVSGKGNLAPSLSIKYDFISKNIDIEFGRYIGNLSNGYRSLKDTVKIKNGSVLDNILKIAKDKTLMQKLSVPLKTASDKENKSFTDFYKNRRQVD